MLDLSNPKRLVRRHANAETLISRSFRRLILAHFLAGITCAAMVDVNAPMAVLPASIINSLFTALVGSELCLLGPAVAAGVERGPRKHGALLFVVSSTLWVWLLISVVLALSKPVVPPFFIFMLAPMVSLAACVFGFALRAWGIRLIRITDTTACQEAFQFTLRHLLLLTGAVAALLAIGRAIRATLTLPLRRLYHELLVLLVMGIVTASVVVVTLWAVLGAGRPAQRAPIAVALAVGGGILPCYYFDAPPQAYGILGAVAALLSLITVASLLVVRRAGYRLVRC